jgi:hypothetical protein
MSRADFIEQFLGSASKDQTSSSFASPCALLWADCEACWVPVHGLSSADSRCDLREVSRFAAVRRWPNQHCGFSPIHSSLQTGYGANLKEP